MTQCVLCVWLKKRSALPTSANVLAKLKRVHYYIRNENTWGASSLPPCMGHAGSLEEKCQATLSPTVRIAVVGLGVLFYLVLFCFYPSVWHGVLNTKWGPWTLPDTKLHSLMSFLFCFVWGLDNNNRGERERVIKVCFVKTLCAKPARKKVWCLKVGTPGLDIVSSLGSIMS